MANVMLTPEAARQLDALNNPIHGRVLNLLVRLEQWPDVSGAKPLSGDLAGHWRLRTVIIASSFMLCLASPRRRTNRPSRIR